MTAVLACNAPFGVGGLGRMLADMATAARDEGRALAVYAGGLGTAPVARWPVTVVGSPLPRLLGRIPPVRFNAGLQQYIEFAQFDRMVARRLVSPPQVTIGFCGQALHLFTRARALGCPRLELIAPTSHLAHVRRQHELAKNRYPLEHDWLNRAHFNRGLAEYALADVIHVCSAYAWDTFVRAGVPVSKLRRFPIAIDPRFEPDPGRQSDGIFRIVYTGALSVVKGTPLLLDAFAEFDCAAAELTLVGSTGSRGMRRLVEHRCADDRRIRLAPGDPLPHLRRADVYVHPSYQDGFAYAVGEALACSVPAIVTQDTGAKELVVPGVNGEIVPTDSKEALLAALVTAHQVFRERVAAPAPV